MLSLVFKCPTIPKVLVSEIRSIQGITQRYFKPDKNIFSSGLTIRTILTKHTRPSNGLVQPISFLKPRNLSKDLLVRHQQTLKLDVNTNVQNNVILYKYENPKYFRNIKYFMFGQLIGWFVLAFVTYRPSLLDIFTTDIKINQYFDDNIWWLLAFFFSSLLGPSVSILIYALNSRTVKFIILNKGGKTLTLVTHHILKNKSRLNNLSVGSVKSASHRTDVGLYVPLKVKNRWFYFLVEKRGTFVNPKLFDYVLT